MKKTILATTIALTTVMVSGCGDKTDAEIALEQRRLELSHELALEKERTKQIEAQHQVADINVEYEFEIEDENRLKEIVYHEQGEIHQLTTTNIPTGNSVRQYADGSGIGVAEEADSDDLYTDGDTVNSDGFSGSDVLVGAVTGAALGYVARELLSSGHSVGSDKYGNTVYLDDKNKKISKSEYDAARLKYPVKSTFSNRVADGKSAISRAGERVKNSKIGKATKKGYEKTKSAAKKTVKLVKEKSKSQKKRSK